MRHWGRGAVAIAAAAIAFFGTVAVAEAADPPAGIVNATVPANAKTTAPGFFAFSAAPNTSVAEQVLVKNGSNAPITVHIDPVDAGTNDQTGVEYSPIGTAPTVVGRWIQVATPVVTLGSQEERLIPFTVHVPANAAEGVHLGGVAVYSPVTPRQAKKTTLGNRSATFNITLQPRRVVAVEATVPGPKAPKMSITGVRAGATRSGISLLLRMKNSGNDYARGTARVQLPDTRLDTTVKIDTFVPGTTISLPVPWSKDVVVGTHAVSVAMKYGKQTLNWDGNVVVNGATKAQLEKQLALGGAHKSSGFPWALVIAGLLLAALLVAGGAFLRRRRQRTPVVYAAPRDDQLAA